MTVNFRPPQLDDADLTQSIKSVKQYQTQLKSLQTRMADLAIACYHNKHRIVVVLEGWDAAGKGGCIRRMVEKLDPRSFRVYPVSAPNVVEADEHYLQRFWNRLPRKGSIAIFDRSWYGRVLVERLERLAAQADWRRAYEEINHFEKMLTADGIVVVKLFLHISQEEQLKRYEARLNDPRKNWKLTAEDLRNREKAEGYRQAYNDMLAKTHRGNAPWHVIAGEYKWFARIECLKTVVSRIEASINTQIPQLSAEEKKAAREQLGLDSAI